MTLCLVVEGFGYEIPRKACSGIKAGGSFGIWVFTYGRGAASTQSNEANLVELAGKKAYRVAPIAGVTTNGLREAVTAQQPPVERGGKNINEC